MAQPLGYRGQQVLELVEVSIRQSGHAPSYAMIASELDMTVSDVCNVVRRLEHRGYLRRRTVGRRKSRGWHAPVIVLTERIA